MTDAEKRRRLELTLAYGGHTHAVDDIVDLVRRGKAQWWGNGDGMIVTELLDFPQKKAVNYWLIFGELKQCLALDAEISEWAVEQGCKIAIAAGRRGWGRVAAPLGWRHRMHMFIKDLPQ